MPPIAYPGNSTSKLARAKSGGGFESAIENAAPPAPGQRVISGTGFGSGPNVVLFDRFMGAHLEQLAAQRAADVGQWTLTSGGTDGTDTWVPRLYEDRGRTWFSQRDPTYIDRTSGQFLTRCFLDFPSMAEFRFSQRRWVPTDKHFPAATQPGVFPSGSVWKPTWFAGSSGTELTGFGGSDGQADVVIDTHIGSGDTIVGGNSSAPRSSDIGSFIGTIYTGFSFTAPTFTSWYQAGVESAEGVRDQEAESLVITDSIQVWNISTQTEPFYASGDTWSAMTKSYSGMQFGAWVGNQGSNAQNDLPLMADAYLAIGPNSRACILTSNSPTAAASTEMYIIPPDSWTDTEIRYTPVSYEALTYTHIILADGTLIENAEGV